MDTVELSLPIPAVEHDRYIAWLEDVATGFVQEEGQLRLYVPTDEWTPNTRERLEARLAADGYPSAVSVNLLADQNWNAVWEEQLSPVRTGPFLICPTPTDVPAEHADAFVLRIDPQMSFGTGHHATTRLALELLAEALDPEGRVLDVGTGTGVLAIAACRSGAASALAVDTSADAVRNARENIAQNDVAGCATVRKGSLDVVPEEDFDLIVANITRRVLLDMIPDLAQRLAPTGTLLMSGVLQGDQNQIVERAAEVHLRVERTPTDEGWWAGRFSFSR